MSERTRKVGILAIGVAGIALTLVCLALFINIFWTRDASNLSLALLVGWMGTMVGNLFGRLRRKWMKEGL